MGKFKKIYVLTPYNHTTGGVELAHQLVDYLNNNNQDAYIVYVKKEMEISESLDITENYKKYNIKVTHSIEDEKDNIIVLPEIYFDFIFVFSKIQIGCWWMSVDNHYTTCYFGDILRFSGFNLRRKMGAIYHRCIKRDVFLGKNSINKIKKEENRIFHFYQSHYAQNHLYSLKLSKVLPLSDYINNDFLGDSIISKRKNIVLYNPSKGLKFTRKIIKKMPHIQFIALQALTREQLRQYMLEAKIYIDFGYFPGKDRLPRETVCNGCCVITGKFGAAAFYEDIPILEKYKFEVKDNNLVSIAKCINHIMSNYEKCSKDFDYFRDSVIKEKEIFFNEIDRIFN